MMMTRHNDFQRSLDSLRRLLAGAAWLYALAVGGLALLWATGLWSSWWVRLSNVLAPHLFAPLLLLLPAALLLRSWSAGLAALAPATIFLSLFVPVLALPGPASIEGNRLRVATLNALYDNRDYAGIVAAIRAVRADVVALQELTPGLAEAIDRELADEYPFRHLTPRDSADGQGIISRLPLRPSPQRDFPGQWAGVAIGGREIAIANVHLPAPRVSGRSTARRDGVELVAGYETGKRDRAAQQMLATIDRVEAPLVLMGDLNTADREPLYRALASRMRDAYRETSRGFGFTFPNQKRVGPLVVPFPLVRIDYVWSAGGVAPAASFVSCSVGGSDHCMVVADLTVER